jgi:ankyrin repeat protein
MPKPENEEERRLEIVETLLKAGANVNSNENENSATSVCIASTINYPKIVKRLIEAGADIHIPQDDGKDPLICSAICGHADVVTLLLANGASMKNTF